MERWTRIAGVVSPVAILSAATAGAVVTPSYDWPTDPLSVIGTTGGGGALVFNAGLVLGGLAAVVFAMGLSGTVGRAVAGLYGLVGVSFAGAGFSPATDGAVLLHEIFGTGALVGIWVLLWAAAGHDWRTGERRRGAATLLLGTLTLVVWLPYDFGLEAARIGYGAAEIVSIVAFGAWTSLTARRLRSDQPMAERESAVRPDGGLPDTDGLLLRQPLTASRAALVETLADVELDPSDALVPDTPVYTASLFLEESASSADSLVWYFELSESERLHGGASADWLDLPDELRGLVADPGTWEVFADSEGTLAVHAALSGRPRTIVTEGGDEVVLVDTSRGDEPATDVVLLRVPVRSGWPARLLSIGVRLMRRLDEVGWIGRRVDAATRPLLEEEAMYTESIFLDGNDLLWYMEVADYAASVEAYETSDSRLARVSAVVLSRFFEEPEVLRDPEPSNEYHLLVHAVSPDRS